jgi:hypothetical protein
MKNTVSWLALLVVVGGIVAASYYYWQQNLLQEPPPVPTTPAPEVQVAPQIRHPIEKTEPVQEVKPLPSLDESKEATQDALRRLFGQQSVQEFFYLEDFVRRLVVTIDNLPRKQVPLRYVPVKLTAGQFVTTGEEDTIFLNPDNYRRYAPYVRLAESVKTKQLVALYTHFYPLFQEAYEELGYPDAYFNDRLVETIDDLLATPQVQGPIKLVQPKVMYEFADPALEARSAGQKILIRMGNENAARIKAKLRDIRRELTG